MKDLQLVCPRPCSYRLGSILPWPPELPGTSDWARGDMPTICAYLEALGERLVAVEKDVARCEQTMAAFPDTFKMVFEVVVGERLKEIERKLKDLDNRTLGSAKF